MYDKAFLQYVGLLHEPLLSTLTSIAAMDFSPFRNASGTCTPTLPTLPPDVPPMVILKATSAILNKLADELKYLVLSCGPMDLLPAYAALIHHFAPNDRQTRNDSAGTFYNMHITPTQNVKMFAAELVKQANVVNLHHGHAKISPSDLEDQLIRGLTTKGGCSDEQEAIYKDALKALALQPQVSLQSMITFITMHSSEPTLDAPPAAHMARTRGGGRGGGRGGKGSRGNRGGRGGKGGKGSGSGVQPNPNNAGQAIWKQTYLVGTGPDGVPLVGKGVPLEDKTSLRQLPCPMRLKFGQCTRQNCEYHHNYNVQMLDPKAPRAPLAFIGANNNATSSAVSNSSNGNQSANTALFPGGIEVLNSPNAVPDQSAHAANVATDEKSSESLQTGSADAYSSDAFHMPYIPREVNDVGYKAVGQVAIFNTDLLDDTAAPVEPTGLYGLFLFYLSCVCSICCVGTYPFRLAIFVLRLALSLLHSICDDRHLLSVALLPLRFPLVLIDVCLTFIFLLPQKIWSFWCPSKPKKKRKLSNSQRLHLHQAKTAFSKPIVDPNHRTLPVLEDSGCTGIMSGDLHLSVGPKRPLKIPVTTANNSVVYSDHVAKISLGGKLLDCLFVPHFKQTLVSKAALVKLGYLPTTDATGRTNYVDSSGNIFLSFQLSTDNLFHLYEHNQPTSFPHNHSSTSSSFSSSF